jgi:hypothetical protein
MIAVSNSFKEEMKKPIKEIDGYILLDNNTEIRNDGDLVSFKISVESSLCRTAMKKLEATIIGNYNLVGKWIKVFYGVKVGTAFEYIDAGSFFVKEVSKKEDSDIMTIIAYDKMINTMIPYEPLSVTYPTTMFEFTQAIAMKCNLILKNTSLINGNLPIAKELYSEINGITYRDILVQIAEASASTCIISEDTLYFKEITDTNEEITYDNLFNLKLKPKYGEINSVVLARTPQEDNLYLKDNASIEANGLTEFKIENNLIMDTQRQVAIIPIFNKLKGTYFYPFEINTEGLGWYEVGDKINLRHENGDLMPIVVFDYSITIDGSIKESLSAKELDKTTTQYQYATKTEKRIKQTELIVDKQEGKINAVVNELGAYDEETSQFIIDSEKIAQIVDFHVDFTRQLKNYDSVVLEDAHPDGIVNLKLTNRLKTLLPHPTLYPSSSLYPKANFIKITNGIDTRYYKLPHFWLHTINGVQDEFIITKEKTTWIKRTNYFETEVLPTEEIIEYPPIQIELLEGNNTLSIVGDGYVFIDCEYAIKNDFTEKFVTEAQLNASIEVAKGQIELSVSEKLDGEEIASRLNLAPDNIKLQSKVLSLEGLTTINDGFVVDLEGNATMNNATIKGGTLKLADSTEIIGGQGLYTLLKYSGDGNIGRVLTYSEMGGGFELVKNDLLLSIYIPTGFKIERAFIVLEQHKTHHADWYYRDQYYDNIYINQYGKLTNVNLYRAIGGGMKVYNSFPFKDYTLSTPITSAFNNYTAPNFDRQLVVSSEIKDSLQTGLNMFVLSNGEPTTQHDYNTPVEDVRNVVSRTAYATATVFVYGYAK